MIMSAKLLASISPAKCMPFEARQVIQPVAVLQVLELGFEDEVEGRAEQAAEQVLLLGQAADPQIDVVEAGDGAGAPRGNIALGIVNSACACRVVGVGAKAVHEVVGVALDRARRGILVGLVEAERHQSDAPRRAWTPCRLRSTMPACVP